MRDGSGWTPGGNSPTGANPPFLRDGVVDGPRIGPRIFIDKTSPHEGGAFILYLLAGTTVDFAGTLLPSCTVNLFDTATNVLLQTTVSDGLGAWSFSTSAASGTYYLVAYLASAPDVYGTTVNTLQVV